ncbi:hypothetical protein JCM3775_005194 [Rhodotorula graminis]|uniref:Transmembrane protein 53 n=1 Tax=Rhodotorula graminis (strain WP1) TaxID=578459 RepID=A0A0P9ESI0_RHOGW|nr:uncharacterized protein RHOBADRAFT_56078 [Rhodotorula graminis WP1]KPV72265.1 hypothetical protein RHOBADRAFT_56078 [Rhodotorula graminis WP1]
MAAKSLFRKLSPAVYLAEPASSLAHGAAAGTSANKAPELILISGWMGAQLKHVEKYAETYRTIYPTSSILLLRSMESDFFRPSKLVHALVPAADVLRSRTSGYTAGPSSGLLVHAFSNGGCLTLKTLNELMRPSRADGRQPIAAATTPLPARAIVFDSCPGQASLSGIIAAFTAGVKSPLVKVPLMGVLSVVYAFLRLWDMIRRRSSILARVAAYFNSPALPPVPRLYLYSTTDKLVPCADVEQHVAEARSLGLEVRAERFEATPHVAHARADPKRYWGAVQQVWEQSGEDK